MNVDDTNKNFLNLLVKWQNLQSTIINIIVSAAKYSISDQKKDSEQYLKEGLLQEEKDALRDLALSIKSINFSFFTGLLSPENVKRINKIERLTLINERDSKIRDEINKSRYGVLYE